MLAIGGTVVGLSIYFTNAKASMTIPSTVSSTTSSIPLTSLATTTKKKDPDTKEAVLMLSTYESSNDPMVITSTGEFHFDNFS